MQEQNQASNGGTGATLMMAAQALASHAGHGGAGGGEGTGGGGGQPGDVPWFWSLVGASGPPGPGDSVSSPLVVLLGLLRMAYVEESLQYSV